MLILADYGGGGKQMLTVLKQKCLKKFNKKILLQIPLKILAFFIYYYHETYFLKCFLFREKGVGHMLT